MPYNEFNTPRVVPAAFSTPPAYTSFPAYWDPYPRYIDVDELGEELKNRARLIVLDAAAPVPPGTPPGTVILRKAI